MAVPTPGARRTESFRPRALAIAGVLVALFAILAVLTTLPPVTAWDARIDVVVNAGVAPDSAAPAVALAVSAAGSPVAVDALTVAAVIVVWVWGARARRVRAMVYLVAARLLELGIETGVKNLVSRRRPVLPHPLTTAQDASFPSGHTAGTTVLCVCLLVLAWPGLWRAARWGWVAAAAATTIAVGASRVLLGLHYVTDVLGGALLGTATALALTPILAEMRPGRGSATGNR